MIESRRVLVANPPSAAAACRGRVGQKPWPARLAAATAWLLQEGHQAWLADSVASGESEASFLTRIAELVMDRVVMAAGPDTLAGDLPLIAAAARPVVVAWSGDPEPAALLLELENVQAVVCGELERGLLAALALPGREVYPSDPIDDVDSLPRPYRDYSVHGYRLPLAGLPAGPQLVMQAAHAPGRRHGVAWLLDDLAFCRRCFPRLTHLTFQDTDLAQQPADLHALAEALAGQDLPWALTLTLDAPTDPAAWTPLARATALDVRLARLPEPDELAALRGLSAAGVALTLAATEPLDLASLAADLAPAEVLAPAASAQPLPSRPARLFVVGQHLPVYMPPWLVEGAKEAGWPVVAVDLRSPTVALGLLRGATPRDIVLVDRCGLSAELVRSLPAKTVLYSPEVLPTLQGTHPHAEQRYSEFKEAAAAYDHVVLHDGHALDWLRAQGHENIAGVVPLPYSPSFHRDLGGLRDIDLLFVGHLSEHRQAWIDTLRAGGVEVTVAQAWGDDYIALLNRAKLVLNLHFTPLPNTELRVVEAMACGAVVVSEPLTPGSELADDAVLVTLDRGHAAETVRALLADPERRAALAGRARAFVAERYTGRRVVERIIEMVSRP